MFDDWPPACLLIKDRLQPLLCRHGANFYPMRVPKQVRVGWYEAGRQRNPWVALLTRTNDSRIALKLRVSRDSGLFKPKGPLDRSPDWQRFDSEQDAGIVVVSAVLPADLSTWVDAAFRHCVDRYGVQLDAIQSAPRLAAAEVARHAKELAEAGEFNPDDEEDGRRRALRSIALREGEPEFRKRLMSHYRARCAITGCRVEEVLEAAHIRPYRGTKTNHSANGLLLRSDLHTLFDRHLITVDRSTMRVLVSPELAGTKYAGLAGRRLRLPKEPAKWPNRKALAMHRHESGL
jgi:hypothetical protein